VRLGLHRTTGGTPCGRSIFTLWVITGRVRMNMIRRTSITSMIGVVLMVLNGCSATVAKAMRRRRCIPFLLDVM
jgi:hypothetical protein